MKRNESKTQNIVPAPFKLGTGSAKNFNDSILLSINWHMNLEVIYITKGSGKISCDFVDCAVKEGELFVINSDVFHGFSSSDSKDFEYIYLEIDRDFCEQHGLDISKIKFTETVKNPNTLEKFQKTVDASKLKSSYSRLAMSSAVLDLLYSLCTSHIAKNRKSAKNKRNNIDNIRAAIVYIRENLSSKLTTAELAVASGISEYYFIREFKRITGYTPVTYINNVRCDVAKRMLFNDNKTIGEVAVACGFDNLPYFTKTFKKYTGFLPSDIKREKRKNEE